MRGVGLWRRDTPLDGRYQVQPDARRDELGAVHEALDRASGAPVQVRLLAPCWRDHAAWLEACDDPAAWIGFTHPAVATPLAIGRLGGLQAVVEPRPIGRPIDELPPPSRDEAFELARKLAEALAAAHGAGLAHGDLRPQLIRVHGQQVVLHGAGLTRLRALAAGYDQLPLRWGHPFYAPPEAGRTPAPTPAGDVYALGVLLYELVWGPPFSGTPAELVRQHREAPLPAPGGEVHAGLARLLLQLTAKDPGRRFRDALPASRALELLCGRAPQPPAWGEAARSAACPESWSSERILRAQSLATDLAPETDPSGRSPRDSSARLDALGGGQEGFDPPLELQSQLGRGPVGATWRGAWRGQEVAIKVVSRRFDSHTWIVDGLREGVGRARAVTHPALVATQEALRYRGRDVFLQELVDGPTLRQRLVEGPLELREALALTDDLLGGLEAAGAAGCAHGDVRPEKVLLGPHGPRLVDLGFAQAACLGASFGAVGLRFGHPAYLAPEAVQERLEQPTPRADVYAAGVMLWELLTGAPPFTDADPRRLLLRHLEEPFPAPADPTRLPAPVRELIAWMTAKDPAARPDPAAARDRLRRVRAEQELELSGLKVEQFDPESSLGEAEWSAFSLDLAAVRASAPAALQESVRLASPRARSARPAPPTPARRSSAALPLGGLLLTVALLAWMAARPAPPPPPADPLAAGPPTRRAPRPGTIEAPGGEAAERPAPVAPQAALAGLERAMNACLDQGDLDGARAVLREAPPAVLVSAAGRAGLRGLQERLADEARRRCEDDLQAVRALAEAGRLVDALEARARAEARWRDRPELLRSPAWDEMDRAVARLRARVDQAVAGLGPPQAPFDPDRVHGALAGALRGWRPGRGAALYPRGGLAISYADPALLLADLEWGGPPPGEPGLEGAAGASAGCTLKLPLERPLEVWVEVEVVDPAPHTSLALLVGADPALRGGVGLTWDGRLRRPEPGEAPRAADRPGPGPLRLELRCPAGPPDAAGALTLTGAVLRGGQTLTRLAPTQVPAGALRGRPGLRLDGPGRVRIVSLGVRGLIDPERLQ